MLNLILGTAQFGFNYGITNAKGKVPQGEVQKILDYCSDFGISSIDTAQSYGDSEKVLGLTIKQHSKFRIISKLFPLDSNVNFQEVESIWSEYLSQSLCNLRTSSLYALLVHSVADLKSDNQPHILSWLSSLKERGLVQKVGISIYESDDLENIDLSAFDIVQLPLSLYDQRMLDNGIIKRLASLEKEIHVRSIFLQGLILSEQNNLPNFFSSEFNAHHKTCRKLLAEHDSSPLLATFSFLHSLSEVHSALIGVESVTQLQTIMQSFDSTRLRNQSFDAFSWHKSSDLDPRNWPKS